MKFMLLVIIATALQFGALIEPMAAQDAVTAEVFRVINIRSGPGTTFSVIGQFTPGTVADVIARSDANNDWLLVQSNGITGWVAYFVVSVQGDPNSLPIMVENPTQQVIPAAAPMLLDEAEASGINAGVIATTFRRANIRTQPGVDAAIVTVVARGEALTVIGRDSIQSDWLQVETPAGTGWVAYFLVTIEGDLSSIPVIQPNTATSNTLMVSTATPVVSINGVTRFNANLREMPSLEADVAATLPFATNVSAEARTADNTWIRIRYQNQTGWTLSALVTLESDIVLLPVAQP